MEVFMKGEDLDFSDVFGGPPRRLVAKEEEIRLRMKEQPVFGGKVMARPRHLSDDNFFDDIFRGDKSSWRTRRDRDNLFGKSSKIQLFFSLPTQSSFPTKLPKVTELQEMKDGSSDGLSSPYSSTGSFSRYSNVTIRDELRYETVRQIFSNEEEVAKVEKDGRSISNRYNFIGNVKGEFAKIFKEEGRDSWPKTPVKKQSHSCRWTASPTKKGENHQMDEDCRSINGLYTSKKTSYASESLRWDSKILGEDLDYPFEEYFELQELSDDPVQDSTPRSEASDETKALDAKIGQWSAGKKGNIRSLLSTLQYVLWPGNEWKAIALVDLVEANPVKRAYQKALLHLHPDKLQQKNVASNHKYIAEKVFDILQEAWDHFNNVALI